MGPWLLVWLGCQQDVLLALGDLTHVSMDGQTVTLQVVAEPEPVAPVRAEAPVGEAEGELDFNPISVPEGARSGGVRWDGVGTKGVRPPPHGGNLQEFPKR